MCGRVCVHKHADFGLRPARMHAWTFLTVTWKCRQMRRRAEAAMTPLLLQHGELLWKSLENNDITSFLSLCYKHFCLLQLKKKKKNQSQQLPVTKTT